MRSTGRLRRLAGLVAAVIAVGDVAWASPTIVSFTPISGPPGTQVLITGAGFDPRSFATVVRFGGATVSPFAVGVDESGGSLRAIVPAGATTGPITVSTSGGTSTSAALRVPWFDVSNVPVMVDFYPRSGNPGQVVTLFGRNLLATLRVEFAGGVVAWPPFDVRVDPSGTTVDAVVPAGAASGPITVVTPGGAASTAVLPPVPPNGSPTFLLGRPPAIEAFVPASGPPGTVVIVSGRNLFGATAVRLGGTSLAIQRVDDRGSAIEAVIAAGASTGRLAVTTLAGTGDTGMLDEPEFVVSSAPRIDDVFPPTGDVGTLVTIAGANFGRAPIPIVPIPIPSENEVRHGGTSWVVEDVNDQRTLIHARVALGSAGTAPLSVQTPGGRVVSADAFTVSAAPVITGFQPASGIPGAVITITGMNLARATGVTFAGAAATTLAPAADGVSVRATVPPDAVTGPVAVRTAAGTADTSALMPPKHFVVLPATPCGDGVVDPGEACDDGALAPGDCCDSTCQFDPSGTACAGDGNACTADVCDGAGACVRVPNTGACDDGVHCNGADACAGGACVLHAGDPCAGGPDCQNVCDEAGRSCLAAAGWPCAPDDDLCSADVCDGAGGCTHAIGPTPSCKGAVRTGAARLDLVRRTASAKDRLAWTIEHAEATTAGELGDPSTVTSYGLCLYDGAGALLWRAVLPPSGTCGATPCWRRGRGRVVYDDPTLGTTGLHHLVVKAGRAGKATVSVAGRGAALGLPSLPITSLPLTVQLHHTGGVCWGAAYGDPKRNDPERFQSKSDRVAEDVRGGTPP